MKWSGSSSLYKPEIFNCCNNYHLMVLKNANRWNLYYTSDCHTMAWELCDWQLYGVGQYKTLKEAKAEVEEIFGE